jgi:hypothetical protein
VLTTPHRELRDHATKGLVALLHRRPHILRRLLDRFREVNDPYVAERLYAIAYGCALRRLPVADLEGLARAVYRNVFADGAPPPHLLLRDYARGIVELAVASGLLSDIVIALARPPYRSAPPGDAPAEDVLRERYYTPFEAGRDEGYFSLWFSLSGGDFARYTVGTNSHSFDWTARPLYGPHPATKRAQYESFVQGLSPALRDRWQSLIGRVWLRRVSLRTESLRDRAAKRTVRGVAKELVESPLAAELLEFRRSLPDHRRSEFDHVRNWANEPFEEHIFDLEYALRCLFQRVVDLGWSPDRFGTFDRRPGAYEGRTSHRSERMGKKYQWLAWHEFTARVADNFALRDDWNHNPQSYHGPWQIHARDIDPSYLGRGGNGLGAAAKRAWWQPVQYGASGDWRRIVDDADWVASRSDLPRLGELVAPTHPCDRTAWWWMRGDIEWREPEPPDEELYERPRRSIRYWVTAHVVRADQRARLLQWARKRDLTNIDLHATYQTTDVFLGEYAWATAFKTQASRQVGRWMRLGEMPVLTLRPAATYYWESRGYDRSIEDTLSVSLPVPALVPVSSPTAPQMWPVGRRRARFCNPSLERIS